MDAWHLGLLQQVASAAFVLCILHVGVLVACSNKKKRPTQVTNSMITQVGPPPTGPAKVQSKKEVRGNAQIWLDPCLGTKTSE